MKKFLTAAFALVLAGLFVLPLQTRATERTVIADGACGENLGWVLYDDGELVISGTGDMADYNSGSRTPWKDHRSAIKTVTVSPGVTGIGENAFAGCGNLLSVALPDSVSRIGWYAFEECAALTEVTIPAAVTQIAEHTFYNCTALEEVRLHSGVTQIDSYAFAGCTGLSRISLPDSVSRIGNNAFAACSSLKEIVIPQSVTRIESQTFFRCGGLENVTVPEGVTFIGSAAFQQCAALKEITLPSSVSSIGRYAFAECTALEKMQIPAAVTVVETCLLYGCTALTDVQLPEDLTAIGENVFGGCGNLRSIVIPEHVASIGSGAFAGCRSLTTLVIPDSVTDIGERAFGHCSGLRTVTLPKNLTEISKDLFYECSLLERVDIPEKVTHIRSGAFDNCDRITKITIPAGVTGIEFGAFYDCSALEQICFLGNAPAMESCFGNVSAMAYYPAGNETWTEEVRQDYGGDITWVSYEGETPEVPDAPEMQWVQATLSLEGNIGINFYVKLSETLAGDENTTMRFTVNGENMDIPLRRAEFRDGKYIFTCPVSAKSMADDVIAQMYTAAGAVGESRILSVRYYAMYMINNSRNPAIVKLMKAMLNYGAAAQMSFNHNTGDLANKDLSEADKVLAEVDASAYAHSVSGSEAGIRASGITLVLETETAVRVLFTLDGSKTIDQYTFRVDDEVVQPQVWSGNVYFIEIPNIAAQDLDDIYNVTVGGLTVRYGGLSYVNQINNLATATQLQKDMAKALYAYWNGAENYFNSL